MIYRAFRHTASGRWLNTIMASDGDEDFAIPAERHLVDVLAAYQSQGWTASDVEVVDAKRDPRKGVHIDPDPAVVDPDAERLAALHALLAVQNLSGPQTSEMLRLERGL